MERTKKTKLGTQLLSIMLALFMVLSMVPNAAFAEVNTDEGVIPNLVVGGDSEEASSVSTGSAITMSILASDGFTPISNEDELRKIGKESGYELDGKYILTGNIILTKPWTPIGDSTTPFTGIFDGDGYTISGLKIESGNAYQGLFGKVRKLEEGKGVIKNLAVDKSTIKVTGVLANAYIGCIAGQVQDGEIINCINKAVIEAADASKVGGIAGDASGTSKITGCANLVSINAKGYSAGIVGNISSGTTKIVNCYNVGEVTTKDTNNGGIVGYANGTTTIQNCYNADTGVRSGNNSGALIGFLGTKSTVNNSYWEGDSSIKGIGNKSAGKIADDCTFKTVEELKETAFLSVINSESPENSRFVSDSIGKNNGYPILECQLPKAEKFKVQFALNVSNALITVEEETQGASQIGSNGIYNLLAGSYNYHISAFGYNDKDGSFVVRDNDNPGIIDIELTEADKQKVSFSDLLQNAIVSIRHESAGIMEPDSDGSYELYSGEYLYSVVVKGYEPIIDKKFKVGDAPLNITPERTKLGIAQPWDGTTKTAVYPVDNTYYIKNGAELAWFASETIAGRLLSNNVVLLDDIDLNGKVWTPMSPYNIAGYYYKGTFEGNYCKISNFNCSGYGLLYRTDKDAVIQNLSISGSITGSSGIGGIVGTNYGTIRNCSTNINIVSSSTSIYDRVGGITGDNVSGTISGCSVSGTITNTFNSTNINKANLALGGIAGQNSGIIEYSYNMAAVSSTGTSTNGFGGIGGITGSNSSTGTIKNCYNVGIVSYTDTSGKSTAAAVTDINNNIVINTYYLDTSCSKGINTGSSDGIQSKNSEEMKDSSFVLSLNNGNSEGPFNLDEDTNINNGYPVLKWQGGKIPETTEDQASVLEDKAALVLTKTVIKEAGNINLPQKGDKGSNITWSSNNSSFISIVNNNAVVTLPNTGTVSVILTATIKKGAITDTKSFTLTVHSKAQIALDELNLAKTQLGTLLRPANGTDTNIVNLAKKILENKDFADISVTLKSAGYTSIGTETYIAADGSIKYYYRNPSENSAMNMAIVRDIEFKLSKDGQSLDTNKIQANIPWDRDRVIQTMQTEVLSKITWDAIKGNNSSMDEVTLALKLPLIVPTARWARISWVSDSFVITPEEQLNPLAETTTGKLNRRATDTDVKLTATVKFNLTTDNESDITVPITFNLKVLGSEDADTPERMQKKLEDNYTLEKLKDFVTNAKLNSNAVQSDIQFPTPAYTGVPDYSNYRFTITSKDTDILEINGYRGYVYRPLPGNNSEKVTFTVTMTSRADASLSVSKDMEITVIPLEQKEIDDALKLMEAVKANYTTAILGENTDKDNITKNLKAFREAIFAEDGKSLIYSRNYLDDKGYGIVVDNLPGSEAGGPGYEQWRTFRSSRPNIIEHEVLRIKQPEYNTSVKIDSCLTHSILGKYALKHPENESLKKLYKQPISATLTVIGEKGNSGTEVKEMSVGTAIVVFKADGSYEVKTAPKEVKINIDDNDGGFTVYGALQATTDEYQGSGNWITSIYGITGPSTGTGGWMFTVNGSVSDTTAGQTVLKEEDQVIWYCTYDYKRDKAPTWVELGGNESENYRIAIKLSKNFVKVGEELPLVAEVQKGGKTVTDKEVMWIGSNAKIAIENGKLIAREAGEVTLTASLVDDKNVRDSVTITVTADNTLTAKQVIDALRKHYINKSTYAFRPAIGYNFTSDNLEKDLLEIAYRFKTNESPKSASDHVGNIIGLISSGKNPYAYNGKNYVKPLIDAQGNDGKFVIGQYDDYSTIIAFSMIALDMAKAEYNVDKAIEALLSYQEASGSFGGADETGMCLTALAKYKDRANVKTAIANGLNYLQTIQDTNTGGIIAWGSENPYSASAVLQGLIAVGENPLSAKWTKNGKTIVDALMRYYKDGHFENAAGVDEMLTEQAFIALADVYRGKSMFNEIKLNVSEAVKIAIQAPNIPKIMEGEFIKLFVTGYASNGSIVPIGKVLWSSSDTNIATVDETGSVVAVKAGNVSITAKLDGKDISKTINLKISAKEFKTEYAGDDKISNGNIFEASLKVENLTAEKKPITFIVALYDNSTNEMLSFEIKKVELSSKEEQDLSMGISIPVSGKYYIRIFLWDSLENQDILMNKFEEFKAN